MEQAEIVGVVVIGLGALVGLFMAFINLLIKPVSDLTVIVTRLMAVQENMAVSHIKSDAKVEALDIRLDVVERKVHELDITRPSIIA